MSHGATTGPDATAPPPHRPDPARTPAQRRQFTTPVVNELQTTASPDVSADTW